MKSQHLFIIFFALLSSAAAAPFFMPSHQSKNQSGSSFINSLRSWTNRGFNYMDDSMLCGEYVKTTNGGVSDDTSFIHAKRARMRKNPLDFKLGCLAQQETNQLEEALMLIGSKAMDAASHNADQLSNPDHGQKLGGGYGQ